MSNFYRFLAPAALGLTSACGADRAAGTSEPPAEPPAFPTAAIAEVGLPPNGFHFAVGAQFQLRASVVAAPGADTTVRWSGGDPRFAVVSPSGVVRTCYPGGQTTVTATSVADPTKTATVPLSVMWPAVGWGLLERVAHAGSDSPVHTDSVGGAVELLLRVTGGSVIQCRAFTDVTLQLEGAAGDTGLRAADPVTPFTDVRILRFPLDAGARRADGSRVLPAGRYVVRATFELTDGLPSQTLTVGVLTLLP